MITAARVTASTTAVALNTATSASQKLAVRNVDTTDTCELSPGDVLYAIRSAAADVDVAVLRS